MAVISVSRDRIALNTLLLIALTRTHAAFVSGTDLSPKLRPRAIELLVSICQTSAETCAVVSACLTMMDIRCAYNTGITLENDKV